MVRQSVEHDVPAARNIAGLALVGPSNVDNCDLVAVVPKVFGLDVLNFAEIGIGLG